jgi:NADH-quinone oxidoreductase subunit L
MTEAAGSISPLVWESIAILLLPLVSFVIIYMVGRKHASVTGYIFTFFVLLAALFSIHILFSSWTSVGLYTTVDWFSLSPDLTFTAGILLNQESAIMLVIVTVISLMVGLYSMVYMKDDPDYHKYFGHLGLFVFSMLGIVISSNLLVLFIFWELVGLSSYLLINHWYQKREAASASTKAFLVNRVGDAAFLLALGIAWTQFRTLELPELYSGMQASQILNGEWIAGTNHLPVLFLTLMGILFFVGAAGKSAQFPFQAWLPDAMAGPTPVSALIHAATMVAAGVFLVARIFPLLTLDVMTLMAFVGGITAFMGAVAALTQYDIKKVLAYSTISQLGYMIMGMGVGAYNASLFHLFTHAFFKAGLFLAAGAVIYGMHKVYHVSNNQSDAQDMRGMGGLRKHMPVTFYSFIILSLALAGIPFFSGFLSKEAIMSGSFAWATAMSDDSPSLFHLVPYTALVTVALTAFYMARQVYLIFFGQPRWLTEHHVSMEPPVSMRAIVMILAVMSLGLLWSFNPFSLYDSWFYNHLLVPAVRVPDFPVTLQPLLVELSRSNHAFISILSSVMILLGFGLALTRYLASRKLGLINTGWFARLSYNNWWLDTLYFKGIVKPVMVLGTTASYIDRKVIDTVIDKSVVAGVIFAKVTGWVDRAVVDGFVHLIASLSKLVGDIFRSVQGGNVQRYVAAAVIIMILLFWLIT